METYLFARRLNDRFVLGLTHCREYWLGYDPYWSKEFDSLEALCLFASSGAPELRKEPLEIQRLRIMISKGELFDIAIGDATIEGFGS